MAITSVRAWWAAVIARLGGTETPSNVRDFWDAVNTHMSGKLRIPTGATVAAAGTVQADAAQLLEGFQLVSGANGTVGIKLPAAAAGAICIIKGTTSGVLKVWPSTGDAINAIAANSAFSLPTGVIPAIFIAIDATTWYSFPLVPS